MGVRYPRRVVGAGGIYIEYDGRDVPDTAMVVADYDEGCQFVVGATMANDTQLGMLTHHAHNFGKRLSEWLSES